MKKVTNEGLEFIGTDALPEPKTSEEVLRQWLNSPAISGGCARMLQLLWERRAQEQRGLSREELGEQTELSPESGTFGTYLSRLRSNGLIQESNGIIEASDSLFIHE